MFWLWIILAAAMIVFVPFARFAIKRTILLVQIKRFCRRNNYIINGTHSFWFLGNRNCKKADLYIETPYELLSIKLFGSLRKNTKIIIKENGEYVIRKYYAFLSSKSQALLFSDSKPKPFSGFSFDVKDSIKSQRNIMIVHPVCVEILRQPQHGKNIIVASGDVIYGMEMFSLKSFIQKAINNSIQ